MKFTHIYKDSCIKKIIHEIFQNILNIILDLTQRRDNNPDIHSNRWIPGF